MRTDETAEEAMMNGFYSVFSSLSKFRYINDAATIGWFRKLMLNECLSLLRKKESLLMASEEEAMTECFDSQIISLLEAEAIFLLITKLPLGYRTIFNLYVIEGYSHQEIATMLNITEGTSKSQLSKARRQMQQFIEQQNQVRDASR